MLDLDPLGLGRLGLSRLPAVGLGGLRLLSGGLERAEDAILGGLRFGVGPRPSRARFTRPPDPAVGLPLPDRLTAPRREEFPAISPPLPLLVPPR